MTSSLPRGQHLRYLPRRCKRYPCWKSGSNSQPGSAKSRKTWSDHGPIRVSFKQLRSTMLFRMTMDIHVFFYPVLSKHLPWDPIVSAIEKTNVFNLSQFSVSGSALCLFCHLLDSSGTTESIHSDRYNLSIRPINLINEAMNESTLPFFFIHLPIFPINLIYLMPFRLSTNLSYMIECYGREYDAVLSHLSYLLRLSCLAVGPIHSIHSIHPIWSVNQSIHP